MSSVAPDDEPEGKYRSSKIISRDDTLNTSAIFDNTSFSTLIDKTSKTNDAEHIPWIEVVRIKLKKFVVASFFGQLYVNTLLILSVLSCFQYIYQTYLDENDPKDLKILDIFGVVELFLAGLFAFDWCLWLFLADHRIEQLLSFFALVDFTTVIPIWLTYFVFPTPRGYNDVSSFGDAINYALHGAYTLRILRALRVHRKLVFIEDEVQRFLSQMALSVLTMILFDAAIMQYLEKQEQNLEFHTWMYFLVVSISTVGYGDISPISTLGRFMAMFFICFAIIFVPQQSNELIEKMNRISFYARSHYKPRGNSKHVFICGDLKSTSLVEFFSELFHEDHEITNLNAVIMQPEPPSNDMHAVLRDPLFNISVHYLDGSPLNDHDLVRAKASTAIAIFVMGNKFSTNPDEEDAKTILQQFSIRRFIMSQPSCDPLFCLQLIRPENRRHLEIEDPDSDKELVVCLNEMKMGIIAKTCMFPGTSTVIFNLLTSFAEDDTESVDSPTGGDDDGTDDDVTEDEEEDDSGMWITEYQKGCDWEIYTTEMAEVFQGARFIDLAHRIYIKLGVILFALKIRDLKGRGGVRVILNPADYVIPSKEKFFVEGFVIAKNKATSDLSFSAIGSSDASQLSVIASGIRNAVEMSSNSGEASLQQRSAPGNKKHTKDKKSLDLPEDKGQAHWQTLMNQYENPDNKQNQQEEIQKMRDQELRKNFFIRDTPQDLASAYIKTSILDEYPYMNNQMIVIAKGLSNLYDFICPLRAKYLGRLCHIVILYPYEIPQHIWRRISIFEGIFHVRGSPLEESDIRRAGIFRASQVVVLADPNAEDRETQAGVDALVDADAIFTYHCVRRLNEKTQVMIEIVKQQNVTYLDPTAGLDSDYKFTPQFAAGLLFTSSMLDSIVCQAFYNPQIIRVLNQLISGTDHIGGGDDEKEPAKKVPMKKGGINAVRQKKGGVNNIRGSALYQISVPEKLESKTYGCLAQELASRGVLPLGLLRGVFSNMSVGARSNKMPYVYTNPSKDTELFSCDKVFVLSQKVLSSTMTSEEVLEGFKHLTHIPQQILGGESWDTSAALLSDKIKDEFSGVTDSQKDLQNSLVTLKQDMHNRFVIVLKAIHELKADVSVATTAKAGGKSNARGARKASVTAVDKKISSGHGARVFQRMQTLHASQTPEGSPLIGLRKSNTDINPDVIRKQMEIDAQMEEEEKMNKDMENELNSPVLPSNM
mmetsp:Transcript_8231/g.15524  ORF Transcript_8231/g.15524 Transcript_8231/m.15524 type:complete len:1217 (+) Transcript_8231:175-3825(+)|eukprot:CAMPEP_0114417028 /NCGR_PEP_ID=MMETSP0103-20121206/2742_1 /TAXON_ID=37642 ORGANISM="Paraphysomonas imperforata, Strain PA2" /NCGR_SAMPLE_ID=MMETSP0103 /ASSEMBLY_ACC=CAM_ASM_000201 /LENGTH=1216 /DNA_ID=CAMNT_0001585287 /DNA_START=166 /DNA_END=3816 /DNA_ORIENTATION=+